MRAGLSPDSRSVPALAPTGPVCPLVTVAICTRNRAGSLERALRSLLPQVTDDTEILVVDNASTDGTPEVVARWAGGQGSVAYRRADQVGLSAARNAALAAARGRYVIFLDDDVVVEPGWLEAYQGFFSDLPSQRVAVVGGAVAPEFESPPPRWFDSGAATLNLGERPKRVHARGSLWGCNIAYQRDVAFQAGGFDPDLGRRGDFLGLHEEAELNQRLERDRHEIWWLPGARIRHVVAPERLRLRWQIRSEFCGGRSSATMRLRAMSSWKDRLVWKAGRLLVSPIHVVLNLVLAALAVCAARHRVAAKALQRVARIAGFGWQLLRDSPATRGAGESFINLRRDPTG
jgi:glucosyl-dolichyl phosphate glucuronosyltransferase